MTVNTLKKEIKDLKHIIKIFEIIESAAVYVFIVLIATITFDLHPRWFSPEYDLFEVAITMLVTLLAFRFITMHLETSIVHKKICIIQSILAESIPGCEEDLKGIEDEKNRTLIRKGGSE